MAHVFNRGRRREREPEPVADDGNAGGMSQEAITAAELELGAYSLVQPVTCQMSALRPTATVVRTLQNRR